LVIIVEAFLRSISNFHWTKETLFTYPPIPPSLNIPAGHPHVLHTCNGKKAVARWALGSYPSKGCPIIAKGEKEICVPMRTNKSDLGHFHSFSNAKEI